MNQNKIVSQWSSTEYKLHVIPVAKIIHARKKWRLQANPENTEYIFVLLSTYYFDAKDITQTFSFSVKNTMSFEIYFNCEISAATLIIVYVGWIENGYRLPTAFILYTFCEQSIVTQ